MFFEKKVIILGSKTMAWFVNCDLAKITKYTLMNHNKHIVVMAYLILK